MAGERILIVAPSWVGDAILSEPLVALLRDPYEDPIVDVLVPLVVRARLRAHARHPADHRESLRARQARSRRPAATSRSSCASEGYTHAFVLPNSWKSALVPYFARIPKRVGYRGEARYGLLTDARRLDRKAMPRLVERFAALAVPRGALVPMPPSPVLVPDTVNRANAMRALHLKTDRPVVILCPGAEFGAAKRWPPNQFAELAAMFLARRAAGVGRRLAERQDRHRRRAELDGRERAPGPRPERAAPTSAPRSTSCPRRRSSSATTPASCTRRPPWACRWSRCSDRRRPSTRRRCRRSRRSPGSTSRAAPASSANARSGISSACAN